MKITNHITFSFSILLSLVACDDGKIYNDNIITQEEGIAVRLSGDLLGLDKWSDGYNIAIAGFGDTDYAIISKNVTSISEESTIVDLVMSGVTPQVKTIELCAIDRLRKRIASFCSIQCNQSTDTLYFNVGQVNVGMHNAIQQCVFNITCAQCHGRSNYAAAGLYLTEGKSYDALVNKPSKLISGEYLVKPGDASTSTLYNILSSDITTTWGYDHSVEVLSTSTLDLIKNWIDSGAEK